MNPDFFSRRIYVSASSTTAILVIPPNVRVDSLIIRPKDADIRISVHAEASTTGLTVQMGEVLEFSKGDLDSLTGVWKYLYAYAEFATYIELMGVVECV